MKSKIIHFADSRKSIENYFEWRKNKANSFVDRVETIESLKDLTILDIGCGYGALCEVLVKRGVKKVIGTEIDQNKLDIANRFLKKRKNVTFIKVYNEKLPFDKNYFDVIFIYDVIEHVKNPNVMIQECKRVLKQNGVLYVCFGPYYSIIGHHLWDFAKWPIHILPKKYIKKIIYSKKLEGYFTHDHFWNQFESLNKIRISEFQRLVSDFKKIRERFIIKYPDVFEIDIPFIDYLGPFKDYFLISFEGIYRNKKKF